MMFVADGDHRRHLSTLDDEVVEEEEEEEEAHEKDLAVHVAVVSGDASVSKVRGRDLTEGRRCGHAHFLSQLHAELAKSDVLRFCHPRPASRLRQQNC